MSSHSYLLSLLAFFLIGLPLASLPVFPGRYPVYIPEVMLILFVFYLISRFRREDWRAIFQDSAIKKYLFIVGGIIVAALLSYLANPHGRVGLGALKSFFFFPALGGLVTLFIFRLEMKRVLLIVTIAFGALVSGVSLGGALFGWGVTYDGRLRGWLDSPNQLAFLVVIPFVFAVLRLFLSGASRRLSRTVWGVLIAVLLIGSALLATRSFTAIGSAIITVWITAFLVANNREKTTLFAIIAMAAFIFAAGLTDKGRSIVSGDDRSSLSSRETIWQVALDIGSDTPVFGVGPMRFQETYLAYQRFYPPYLEWAVPHPHNLALAFWLETGVIGALSYILACVVLFRALWQGLRQSKKEQIIMIAPFLTLFLIGLVDTPFFRFDLAFFFFFSLAMLLASDYSSMRYTFPLSRSRK